MATAAKFNQNTEKNNNMNKQKRKSKQKRTTMHTNKITKKYNRDVL